MLKVSKKGADIIDYAQPPYNFEGMSLIAFVLELGSSTKLQKVCNTYLNGPLGLKPGERGYYTPQHPQVIISFCNYPKVTSDQTSGFSSDFVRYQEVSLAFPVAEEKTRQTYYYVPILFIDGPPLSQSESHANETAATRQTSPIGATSEDWQTIFPIVVGRELFGLPKTRGEIRFNFDAFKSPPGEGKAGGAVWTTRPDRDAAARLQEFITVSPLDDTHGMPGAAAGSADSDQALTFQRHLDSTYRRGLLGLRQVHDPRDISKTLYHDVIMSEFSIFELPASSSAGYRVKIDENAYPQITAMLGLESTYDVPPNRVNIILDATASYADPKTTRILEPRGSGEPTQAPMTAE